MLIFKKLFVLFWIVFGGGITLLVALGALANNDYSHLIQVSFFMAFAYFAFIRYFSNYVNHVFDYEDHLLVKKGKHEVKLKLTNIINVDTGGLYAVSGVTLNLKEETLLGKNVSFFPNAKFVKSTKANIGKSLMGKVESAKNDS